MLEKSFSLLFYLKKPKNYLKGNMLPTYLRITVDGIPKEISAGRQCDPEKWNANAGRVNGTKEDVKSLNAYLDILQTKVYEVRRKLLEKNEMITADGLKAASERNAGDTANALLILKNESPSLNIDAGNYCIINGIQQAGELCFLQLNVFGVS